MFKELEIINAVPGAGKTTYMINEATQWVLEYKCRIMEVAYVTFTKSAAAVAKERISLALAERKGVKCVFGKYSMAYRYFQTIHSMCFRALGLQREDMLPPSAVFEFNQMYGYKKFYGAADSVKYGAQSGHYDHRIVKQDNGDLLAHLAGLYRINRHTYAEEMRRSAITRAGITHAHVIQYITRWEGFKESKRDEVLAVFNGDEVKKRVYDYTDILEEYVNRQMCEEHVKVAFIDEAQDLSELQWKVLMMAFRKAEKVYIVADPRQNMFRWAGSSVEVMLSLEGKRRTMDTNYRCKSNIVDYVNTHIVKHIERKDKLGICMKAHKEGGEVHTIYSMNDIAHDSALVNPHEKMLMLSADNAGAAVYRDWCLGMGIPFTWMGRPLFNTDDKKEYIDNGKNIPDDWDADKKAAAHVYHELGTLLYEPTVHIKTIHQAKGDEADSVVVSSSLPKKMYNAYLEDPYYTDLLFYVACTRARSRLYIYRDLAHSLQYTAI